MNQSGENQRAESIAPQSPVTQQKGTGVAPSPFNAVKLELALILVMAACLVLLLPATLTGILWLAGYALVAALWLAWRTRRVLRHHDGTENEHGT